MIADDLKALAFPVDQLTELEGNPRRGNADAVARSYERFGQRKPIVARRRDGVNEVIAGNHQLQAARKLGWPEIAVTWADDLSDDDARGLALADNRTADLGTYDNDALAVMLSYVADDADLLAASGYDLAAIEKLLGVPDLPPDSDEVPEPPTIPVSAPGDVWLVGPHRVVCGDATDPDVVDRLMVGAEADVVFCDPPYNADYSSRVDKDRRKPWGGILNDAMSDQDFGTFLALLLGEMARASRPGASVYVWTDWKHVGQVADLFASPFTQKGLIVWDKGHFGLGTYYRTQHELCLFGVVGDRPATWTADHDERDVWSISRDPSGNYVHPTQKPVALGVRALRNSSNAGDIVLDLCGGSGTTLIAAHETGRVARLIELDPKYVDVICRRYQVLTGGKPVLESTGEPHDFAA